jgi:hypothetical protein
MNINRSNSKHLPNTYKYISKTFRGLEIVIDTINTIVSEIRSVYSYSTIFYFSKSSMLNFLCARVRSFKVWRHIKNWVPPLHKSSLEKWANPTDLFHSKSFFFENNDTLQRFPNFLLRGAFYFEPNLVMVPGCE